MIPALRRQLPAHSPVSLRGVIAAIAGGVHESADLRREVAASVQDAYGASSALLVASGTDALRLALAGVCATTTRRHVALPAYSCYDVATAAEGADVGVVLYDIDPLTLGPEDRSLRAALESQPAAIVGAHLYGYPVDMERLGGMARDAGAVLIEDAAQASGGRFRGRALGSFGSLTVASFGRGKGMTAGAGGALLAHDEVGERIVAWAARRLRPPAAGLRDAAMLGVQWTLGRPAWYWLPAMLPFLRLGETVYQPPSPPSAMSGASTRALRVAMLARDADVEVRRASARRFYAAASASRSVRVVEPVAGADPGFLRFPIRTVGTTVAQALRTIGRHGAAPSYPLVLASLPSFGKRVLNRREVLDGARTLADTLLTLPTHRFVEPSDFAALEQWIGGQSGLPA